MVQERTFIQLEPEDMEFVRWLRQQVQQNSPSRKKPPSLGVVIRAVLRDYKRVLVLTTYPDFLSSYKGLSSKTK